MRDDQLKRRIETKYEAEERHVETKQYAGQMTIAFCAAGGACPTLDNECPLTAQ